MTHALNANRKIFEQWSEITMRFDVQYGLLSATMIAKDLDLRGEQFKELSDRMKAVAASGQRQMDEAEEAKKFQAATKQAIDQSEGLAAGSCLAIHGMQIALVLLCISAIVLVLCM